MANTTLLLKDNFGTLVTKFNQLSGVVGDTATLNTTADSAVGAINELLASLDSETTRNITQDGQIAVLDSDLAAYIVSNDARSTVIESTAAALDSDVGARVNLTTTDRSSLVAAINELDSVGLKSVAQDPTPQLGGNLDLNSNTINGTGTISYVGDFTSTNITADSAITASTLILSDSANVAGTVTALDFNATSDLVLKEDLTPLTDLQKILNGLNGMSFTWKHNGKRSIGVAAQDVEVVLPTAVSEHNGFKRVNYNQIVAVLVEVVKQQQEQINTLLSHFTNHK